MDFFALTLVFLGLLAWLATRTGGAAGQRALFAHVVARRGFAPLDSEEDLDRARNLARRYPPLLAADLVTRDNAISIPRLGPLGGLRRHVEARLTTEPDVELAFGLRSEGRCLHLLDVARGLHVRDPRLARLESVCNRSLYMVTVLGEDVALSIRSPLVIRAVDRPGDSAPYIYQAQSHMVSLEEDLLDEFGRQFFVWSRDGRGSPIPEALQRVLLRQCDALFSRRHGQLLLTRDGWSLTLPAVRDWDDLDLVLDAGSEIASAISPRPDASPGEREAASTVRRFLDGLRTTPGDPTAVEEVEDHPVLREYRNEGSITAEVEEVRREGDVVLVDVSFEMPTPELEPTCAWLRGEPMRIAVAGEPGSQVVDLEQSCSAAASPFDGPVTRELLRWASVTRSEAIEPFERRLDGSLVAGIKVEIDWPSFAEGPRGPLGPLLTAVAEAIIRGRTIDEQSRIRAVLGRLRVTAADNPGVALRDRCLEIGFDGRAPFDAATVESAIRKAIV